MTWLILGGTGQLGIALSRELGQRGILFQAWGSKELDITQAEIVRNTIVELSPSVIVNCAAWTNVDGAEGNEFQASKVNGEGARNLALAAKFCGSKFVQISTDYVFSGDSDVPWPELSPTSPQTAYGRSKAIGEKMVFDVYPEKSYIIRTAWLYSPWGKNFAKTMVKLAKNTDKEVRVVDDQFGQPTSAQDLSEMIVQSILLDIPAGIYHATNSGKATWFEFAKEIFHLVGAEKHRVIPVSSDEYFQIAVRPKYSVLGHNEWRTNKIEPMREWKIALSESISSIA